MNESPKAKALKRLGFAVALLAICVVGYLVTSSYARPVPLAQPQPAATSSVPEATSTPDTVPSGTPAAVPVREGDVTLDGMIVCLPHHDTGGPQTLECALGFKADSGAHYGLATKRAADYSVTTREPTGTRIRVKGRVTPAEALSADTWMTYDIVGVVDVTSIEKL